MWNQHGNVDTSSEELVNAPASTWYDIADQSFQWKIESRIKEDK